VPSFRIAFTLPFAALAACGSADARTALNEPVVDTLPGGIVQVTNPGPTAWPDTSGWRIVEELVISPEEGSEGELSTANTLVADEVGNVYVMQREPVHIKVFGPDGEWVRNIGREGDGPGEFRNGMLGIVGDTLIIQDPNNSRLTTFLTNGTFLATHQSQCCWFSSTFPVLADGRAMIMGPPPPGAEGRGAYYLTGTDGRVTDTLLMPADQPGEAGDYWEVTRRSGQSVSISRINVPLRAGDVLAIRPDGRIVSGRTDRYQLSLGDDFADTSRVFTAPAPTLSVTDAQRDSAYNATIERQTEDWRESFAEVAKLGDIPSSWPVFTAITVDRANRTWVALPGDRGGYSRLQVFSPEGFLLGDVPAPAHGGGIFNGFWTRDRIYVGGEDDLGLPIIRVFRLRTEASTTAD
jgi:hypothetical protein